MSDVSSVKVCPHLLNMSLMKCVSFTKSTLRSVYFTTQQLQVSGHHTCVRRLSTMSHIIPPILSVSPSRALVDEKIKVVVENLPPASPVTLHSLHHSEDQDYWEAYGHYISDQRGTVSVAEDLSFGGTYTGKEAMGLLWSMRPVPGSRKGLRLRKRNICIPQQVNISVYRGHIVEGFMEQAPLASSPAERWFMGPGVRRIEINEKGVLGTLFLPPGPGPFPGVLDIWGGGGGLLEYRSSTLASHGYASLALAYFGPGNLKSLEVEVNYFEKAFTILRDHPLVIPDKVGIFGLSLGSIVAIFLAAESSVVEPCCVVCISGNHIYPFGKTIKGLYQVLHKNCHKMRLDEDNHQIWRGMLLPIPTDLSWKVDVREINCPMLLVNGQDDQTMPSAEAAEDMVQMMRSVGKEHLVTRVEYPDAGHLIEPPYSPHFRATNFIVDGSNEKVQLLWGGRTKPHSDAQEDSWNRILAFLQQHLYSRPTPPAVM